MTSPGVASPRAHAAPLLPPDGLAPLCTFHSALFGLHCSPYTRFHSSSVAPSPCHPLTPSPRHPLPAAGTIWPRDVLEGHSVSAEEGLAVLKAADDELLDLLAAAYRVRHRWFGNRVHLNFLINAKSGHCGEDCGYCSQSRVSRAEIARYELLGPEQVLDGARQAAQRRAGTYCIVTSGLRPGPREMELIATVVPEIKRTLGLRVCVSPGLLGPEEAARLRACGVDRVNHNLNTSRRFYPRICTTPHLPGAARRRCVPSARPGLEICSGGIVGMGEDAGRRGRAGLAAGRAAGRGRAGELPDPDPRHAAGRRASASIPATA